MKVFRFAAGFALIVGLAGCGGSGGTAEQAAVTMPAMPEVKGKQLDVALSDIKRAGFEDEVEVIGGGTFGVVVESNWQVCDQLPAAGEDIEDAPRLTVDRSCDDGDPADAVTTSTSPPEPEASAPEPGPATTIATAYTGPGYEIVEVVDRAGMGELDQYWVYTEGLDYATDAYRGPIKLLISDVARAAGTNRLIVEVVTDKEIAEANADPAKFEAERGTDYWLNVIPEKEKAGWIASYTGGIDYDAGALSDSDTAFGIDWLPASENPTSERWKP